MSSSAVVVLSDAHLGDTKSWLHLPEVQGAVISSIKGRPEVDTLVLLGDTLDLNFGTLTVAVEGKRDGSSHSRRGPGFRALMDGICGRTQVEKIVYVAGNHDYMVWEWEARRRNALRELAEGKRLSGEVMTRGKMADHFLAGVLPKDRRSCFSVEFPDHTVEVDNHRVVLTHGHYFARIQTGLICFKGLAKCHDRARFMRDLAIASAQYQALAHASAIRRRTRRGIHRLYLPLARAAEGWRSLRGRAPSKQTLRDINTFIHCVAEDAHASAFVFGHTHVPGEWRTPDDGARNWRSTPVLNCGSFAPPRRFPASMLLLSAEGEELAADLISITRDGTSSAERICTAKRPTSSGSEADTG